MNEPNTDVVERLDILISLLIPRFDEARYQFKGTSLDVFRLCDAEHTVNEIAKKLGKTKHAVEVILSRLRGSGHIKSITRDSRICYVRLI